MLTFKAQTPMKSLSFGIAVILATSSDSAAQPTPSTEDVATYRRFEVTDTEDRVVATEALPDFHPPLWARNVSQSTKNWTSATTTSPASFADPIPFVVAPRDSGEPFHSHNHQPSITWLPNGDLLAIWYSTVRETGTELTVLASRLRDGESAWDPSSEFFKATDRNMHGSAVFHDGKGTLFHFNGMGKKGVSSRERTLALLLRTSADNGVTWSQPRAIAPRYTRRHQAISGTILTSKGALIQPCDDAENGGSALQISMDHGATWFDPGEGKPPPRFEAGGHGEGTIAGIHGAIVELKNGLLMSLARGATLDGRMPASLSRDDGITWEYEPSPFPPIGRIQRLVFVRLLEGPLMLVSFTSENYKEPEANGMTFVDSNGREFTGHGMYAALSFDEGKTWPVRKLLTPGKGDHNGGARTDRFTATPTRAEHGGYLAVTQSPDGIVHLISSGLYYRFNLKWLKAGITPKR